MNTSYSRNDKTASYSVPQPTNPDDIRFIEVHPTIPPNNGIPIVVTKH